MPQNHFLKQSGCFKISKGNDFTYYCSIINFIYKQKGVNHDNLDFNIFLYVTMIRTL